MVDDDYFSDTSDDELGGENRPKDLRLLLKRENQKRIKDALKEMVRQVQEVKINYEIDIKFRA